MADPTRTTASVLSGPTAPTAASVAAVVPGPDREPDRAMTTEGAEAAEGVIASTNAKRAPCVAIQPVHATGSTVSRDRMAAGTGGSTLDAQTLQPAANRSVASSSASPASGKRSRPCSSKSQLLPEPSSPKRVVVFVARDDRRVPDAGTLQRLATDRRIGDLAEIVHAPVLAPSRRRGSHRCGWRRRSSSPLPHSSLWQPEASGSFAQAR